MLDERELIKRLRDYFELSEDMSSDENLLYTTKGSFGRETIEFHMEVQNFLTEINNGLRKITKKES